MSSNLSIVLILVVVEDSLGVNSLRTAERISENVLILVVVEDSLGVQVVVIVG